MTIGFSIFLIAAGAILRFATHFHLAHVDVHTVGVILIAGTLGLIIGSTCERPPRGADVKVSRSKKFGRWSVVREERPPSDRRY